MLVLLVGQWGCGESDSEGTDATDAAVGADAADAADTITVSGTVRDWISLEVEGAPIGGASVCLRGATPEHCVTADPAGNYSLDGVPRSQDFGIVATAVGYVRTVVLWRPTTSDLDGFGLFLTSDALAQQKVELAGGTWPLGQTALVEGQPLESATGFEPVSGVTATMTPMSGIGPSYLDTSAFPDATLSATSSIGIVMFFNAAPGPVELGFAWAGGSCVMPEDGWAGSKPGTVGIEAEANSMVYITVICR
jgi:hypothetical protein